MFVCNESIKFMMAKIYFSLAEFSILEIKEPTNLKFQGVDTLVFILIKKGNGKVIINKKEFLITEDSYIVIAPFSAYQLIPDGYLEYYSFYLSVDKSRGYQNYTYLLNDSRVGIDKYNIAYLFNMLYKEFKEKQIGYSEIAVSMFKTIIVSILRNENITGERLSYWKLNNSQFQIEQILQNEFKTITLDELANKLFMSPRDLQRYLKENYRKSFIELRNDARMAFAANKLKYTDLSIADISDLVGYSSIEHFSYAFKKYYGISPLKYRKSDEN